MHKALISTCLGIGPVTQGRLGKAGNLRALGSIAVFGRLKFLCPTQVSLNALYGLEGARRGCGRLELPPGVKSVLREEARAVHSAFRKGLASRSGTL
jgi:hypothetical protein